MAINIKKELDRWNWDRAVSLLKIIEEQHPKKVTPEKMEILRLAVLDDRVFEAIRLKGMQRTFVNMIHSSDVNTQVATCRFMKECYMYEGFENVVREKFMRMLELLGDDKRGQMAVWEATSTVCHMARNENIHKDVLESTYSLIDMYRSREWASERAAGTLSAYAFTNPYLLEAAVGVTARTDIVQRANNAYNKSFDYIARRTSLKTLIAAGRGRSTMTNDEVTSLRNSLRVFSGSLDFATYFSTTFIYSLARHYHHWGIKGQVSTVLLSCFLASSLSGGFAAYTGEWLKYKVEEMKYAYFLETEREKRKDVLRKMKKAMSRLPGGREIPLGESIPERYTTLGDITSEVNDTVHMAYQYGVIALLTLSFPLPWYFFVPKILTTYQQLSLGPRFHRIFPALSLKFTRRPRAIIPYVLLPTAALKAADHFFPNYVSPLRLYTF